MSMQAPASLSHTFDLESGLSGEATPLRRYLSNMKGFFADRDAFSKQLEHEDVLVYEFFDLGLPERETEVAHGTSIVYPGKIGNEYFMTKGHFHTVLEAAEVYYCLRGQGYMMMENPEGDWEARQLTPGTAVYVPGRYAHRSVNVSAAEPLVTFFAFPANAGHDYGTIETTGFRKLVVERDGVPEFVDNPHWAG